MSIAPVVAAVVVAAAAAAAVAAAAAAAGTAATAAAGTGAAGVVADCSLCQTIWTRGLPTRDSSSITGLVLDKSFP